MKSKAILLACVLLASCQSSKQDARTPERYEQNLSSSLSAANKHIASPQVRSAPRPNSNDASDVQRDLWNFISNELKMEIPASPQIDEQKNNYLKHKHSLLTLTLRAEPYMHGIVEQIKQRDLPMELVLLPIVESAFDPHATSSANAAGLWQFVPKTGKRYGLKSDKWYDGRRDVIASTTAALDMLQYLNRLFEGDWLLTMAAYNCGEGCVMRAMKANNLEGKPTEFWALSLPRETSLYIPKILALSDIIKNNKKYGIKLPKTDKKRALARIDVGRQIQLTQAAQMAGLSLTQIKAYNPAYKKGITAPDGPHYILVPQQNVAKLKSSLSSKKIASVVPQQRTKNSGLSGTKEYKVRSGDTLSTIASRLNVKSRDLQRWNDLHDQSTLRVGQVLRVPNHNKSITYQVRKGDSLFSIARRHGVDIADMKRWNSVLNKSKNLQPGLKLTLFVNHKTAPGA